MLNVPADPAPVALVTGSDRGIGLALTRELIRRGWRVSATCRKPEHAADLKTLAATHAALIIERLDVADNHSIDALATRLRGQCSRKSREYKLAAVHVHHKFTPGAGAQRTDQNLVNARWAMAWATVRAWAEFPKPSTDTNR